MATITYEYHQSTPAWASMGANTLVFSGSATDLTESISTIDWNDGVHIGDGDPGADQCVSGDNSGHINCVKYVDSTHFILNGGASEVLNDTNLLDTECTLRIHLNNGTAVETQNSYFFCFDGATDTAEAVGVECYAFERGESASAWTQINDDSGDIGGNNAGERLDLGEETSGVDLYWYLALSARGETAGGKSSFDFKIVTEIY